MNEMKKVYEITVMMCGEESTLTITNPPRRWLKEGYVEYSGAKIIRVKKV